MKHLYLFLLLLPIISVQAQFENGRPIIFDGHDLTYEFQDLDNDGDVDILIIDPYLSLYHIKVSSMLNDGTAHFELATLLPISGDSFSDWDWSTEDPMNVQFFSINSDEFPDMLISRSIGGNIFTWHYALGDGSGGFGAIQPYTSLNTLFDPAICRVKDLNKDGRADVISDIDGADSSINVNYSSDIDTWMGWETIDLMSPVSPDYTVENMRAFDVNLDSEADFLDVRIIQNAPEPEVLEVFYAENDLGNYTVEVLAEIVIDENAGYPNWFIEDWNGDGYEDLLVLVGINYSDPQRAYLFENMGGQLSSEYLEISLPLLSYAYPLNRVADLNGDGLLDLYAKDYAFLNTDSPNWTFIQMNFSTDGTYLNANSEATDLNGDGKDDLLVSMGGGGFYENLYTYLNTSIATFEFDEQLAIGEPTVWSMEDADADGDADIIGEMAGQTYFGHNVGMNFSWQHVGPGIGEFGDVDGDGDLDIVTNDGGLSQTITLYENVNGVFTLTQQISGSLVDYSKFFDTNADGSADLVYFDGEELIVRRAMNGLFGEEENLCPTCDINEYQKMEYTDMDNDGWVDVIYIDNLISDFNFDLFYTRNINGIMVPQSSTVVGMGDFYYGFIGFIDYNSDGIKDVYLSSEDFIGAPQILISTSAFSSDSGDWLPMEFQWAYNIYDFDYNQDGWSDLIVGQYNSPMMNIMVGTGVGTFEQGPSYVLGPEGSPMNAMGINNAVSDFPCYLSDFDGDGDLDFGLQLVFESAFVYFENLEINIPINILENEQELNTDGLLLYPNPSSDIVNLVFTEPGLHQVDVYDMYGKLVWTDSRSDSNWTINVSTWAKGIYVARAENGKSSRLIVE